MRAAGIILAAGASSRFGEVKAIAPFQGRPLLQYAIDAAAAAGLAETVVVIGASADRVLAALGEQSARVVVNPTPELGLSSSLKLALAALPHDVDAAAILLGNFEEDGSGTGILQARLALDHHMQIARHLYELDGYQLMSRLQAPLLLMPAGHPDHEDLPKVRAMDHARRVMGDRVRVTWVDGVHDIPVQRPVEVAEAMLIAPGEMPDFSGLSDTDRDAVVSYVVFLQTQPNPGGASIGGIGPVPEGFAGWVLGLGLILVVVLVVGRDWRGRRV